MTNNILLTIIIVIAWLFILLPSVIYLMTSWKRRKDKLFALLNEEAIKLYFTQFYPNEKFTGKNIKSNFRKHFKQLYGTRHYVLPLIILAVLSLIGLAVTLFSVESLLGESDYPVKFPTIAISAFLGAYTWILGDQLVRYQKNDFTYYNVYNAVYRLLVAIPLGLSLSYFAKEEIAIPFVFLLAAFPIQTLLKFSRRIVSQKLGLGETDTDNGQLELQQLEGMSLNNSERYQEEGISTIAELAWADPIDLMIRTNKDFSFVIDTISQALLWIYFDKETKLLYKYSLRGAQEVCYFLDDLNSDEPKTKAAAEKTRDKCAELLSMTPDSFIFTLLSVRDDPYAQFLFNIWH